jgi:D,D-heptose 1,7-bisphosphate phosphatase
MMVVVITNQSGVARGYFDEAFVDAVHERLRGMLRQEGASLDGIYFCPHHPTEGSERYVRNCTCRKPAPGMLLKAAEELSIDPERSFMIGDTVKDIEAGSKFGARGILVLTGYGAEAAEAFNAAAKSRLQGIDGENGPPADEPLVRPAHIATDILAAVRWLLKDRET